MNGGRLWVRAGVVGILLLCALGMLRADDDAAKKPSKDELAAMDASLKWQKGTITIKDGLAKLQLTPQYRFLGAADAQKVLHEMWGNPEDPNILGMIFPDPYDPMDHGVWAMTVEYEENGYVQDSDANTINYDELLKKMQQQALDSNDERKRLGYPTVELVGWATPPHYDAGTHKLYWAKELHFGDFPKNTLNYNIRILGRRGVLFLNAIAPMRALPDVENHVPQILSMVDFQPGNLYSDFDPKVDKVAKYGIAALIAGGALGLAAKAGAFKLLLPALLALKKFIVVAVVAVVAAIKKLFGRSSTKSGGPDLPQQRR